MEVNDLTRGWEMGIRLLKEFNLWVSLSKGKTINISLTSGFWHHVISNWSKIKINVVIKTHMAPI